MSKLYRDWRRSEAYGVPMSKEGLVTSEWRYKGFKQGYFAGLQRSITEMERLHRENKKLHRFYLIAKEELEGLQDSIRQEEINDA